MVCNSVGIYRALNDWHKSQRGHYLVGFCLLLLIAACNNQYATTPANTQLSETLSAPKPNILLIVADDLGYSDLGSFGGEINTPHLDALAENGIKLTNFYAAPTCSPSRAMMLTGVDSHLTGLGIMAERMSSDYEGIPGYEGYLNRDVVVVSDILKGVGYHTYMTGKWHFGHSKDNTPAARGFDRSFALMEGGASHLDNRPQLDPEKTGRYKPHYTENGKDTDIPEGFYSSRFYAEKMIEYIKANRHSGKPFFAYLSFTAPHFPLQVPKFSRNKYSGAYDKGYDFIYAQRLEKMRMLKIIASHAGEFMRTGQQVPWENLSAEKKAFEARRMELHAAMVDDMDAYIGKVLDYLRQIGEYDNTFIIFMSDNGVEGREIDQAIKPIGDWPHRCCDNSLDNMGAASSYVWLGSNWGRVSSGPYRGYKSNTADGGIRVPAIIHYPDQPPIRRISNQFISVLDLVPTFLSLANIPHPAPHFQGGKVYAPEGASMLSYLQGESESVHGQDYAMGWELSKRRALKQGEWKLLWDNEPFGSDRWTLYNLSEDPGEVNDLSKQDPERLAAMIKLWNDYKKRNNVIIPQ